MDHKLFEKLIAEESEYRKAGLSAVYNLFPDADEFLEWVLNTKTNFTSEIEAVARYLSAHSENRMIEVNDGIIEVATSKYDYHIKIVDNSLLATKFHGHIADNSNANLGSVETLNPKDLIQYILD